MIIFKRFFLSLILVVITAAAYGQTAADKNETNRKYDYFYLEAVTKRLNEDYGAAFTLLNHCIALCPERPEAYYDRGTLYNTLNKGEYAIEDFKKALSLNKSEKTYKKSLFYQMLVTADYEGAKQLGEELCAQSADIQIYSILLSIYSTQKDYDGMLRTLDNIEKINGNDENITLTKMQIFELRGEKNRAFEELKKLSDSNPRNTSYKIMLGNWMLQNERAEEAYNVYKEVLDANPDDMAANMSMLDYYREMNRIEEADSIAEKMLMNPETPGESKVLLMNQLIQGIQSQTDDSTKVVEMFDKILASPGPNPDIAEMKAAYMSVKKMPQEKVIDAFLYALSQDPARLSVRLQLLQEYWNKKDLASVIKYSEPTESYHPDDITVYYFLGLAHYLSDDDVKALEALQAGTEYVDDECNPLIVSDVYNIIGDILHSKGRVEEAYCAYDSCLQYNEKNIPCLNNYAYYLSLEERDLERAEKMSQKTVAAEPNNNTYLDTYAWILFLRGKYLDAKVYMEQLLSNAKQDEDLGPVIYEHIGDVYIMNGDAEKALKYWKIAEALGSENKVLPKKIKKLKYIPEKKK